MQRTTRKNESPNKARNERGATSVLVIFMMMILVTLGAFAITSASANLRFSQRALEWNDTYYTLDALGEGFLFELDTALARAEDAALKYIHSGAFRSAAPGELPQDMQMAIFNGYITSGSLQNDYIRTAFVNVYMYYADIYINEMLGGHPGMEVYASDDGTFVDSVLIMTTLKTDRPEDELSSLIISVWAMPPEYSFEMSNGTLTSLRDAASVRYWVDDWYEHQEPIYEEPQTELWDGTI